VGSSWSSSAGPITLPLPTVHARQHVPRKYGATIAHLPIDDMTLDYLRLSGREEPHVKLVEAYAKAQGMFRVSGAVRSVYSKRSELDLATVEPSLAGRSDRRSRGR